MPTFHPSYVLRQYTVPVRQSVFDDTQQVLERLGRPTLRRPSEGEGSEE